MSRFYSTLHIIWAFAVEKKMTPYIVSLFILLWVTKTMIHEKQWKTDTYVISSDVIWYYEYLPAIFIYHDYTLEFIDKYKGTHKFTMDLKELPNHKKVIKTSMGMSLLYAPFFFVGHGYALLSNYDAGGYSQPYRIAIMLASFFYLMLGLFYLSKLLLKYFDQYVSSWVILLIVFGTNLYYYATYCTGFTHQYAFALIAMFLWYTIKWHESKKYKYSIILGILIGLISLVRPTNILVLIFFVLWDIKSIHDIKKQLFIFFKEYKKLMIIILCSVIIWVPQFLYWKAISGSFLCYSYVGERFFFDNPHVLKGLFSYRKGWLLYSPVMIFSVIGLVFLTKKTKEMSFAIYLFLLLFVYMIFSWWCWWYGGSFGLRAMIDIYAVWAIPMAAFFTWVYVQKKVIKSFFILISALLLLVGMHHTNKYLHGSIHYDSMTKESWMDSYFSVYPSESFYSKLRAPEAQRVHDGFEEHEPSK